MGGGRSSSGRGSQGARWAPISFFAVISSISFFLFAASVGSCVVVCRF
jgi:hypothetical protein